MSNFWIEGALRKPDKGKYWEVEAASLFIYTQGTSKKEALFMIKDAVETLAECEGYKLKVDVKSDKDGRIYIGSKDAKLLIAFLLRRQRQKNNLTISQVVQNMGAKSNTAYARYEKGNSEPGVSKLKDLLTAINPDSVTALNVA